MTQDSEGDHRVKFHHDAGYAGLCGDCSQDGVGADTQICQDEADKRRRERDAVATEATAAAERVMAGADRAETRREVRAIYLATNLYHLSAGAGYAFDQALLMLEQGGERADAFAMARLACRALYISDE